MQMTPLSVFEPQRDAPPMPLEPILGAKELAHFKALQIGVFLFLARAYWLGGARPLPTDDTTLLLLSGCHARQWQAIRGPVLDAFRKLEPKIAGVYAQIVNTRETQLRTGRIANAASMASRALKSASVTRPGRSFDDSGEGRLAAKINSSSPISKENRDTSGQVIPKHVTRGDRKRFNDATVATDAAE